ncbi:hypothetical protein [Caballeronia sp. KNU42]
MRAVVLVLLLVVSSWACAQASGVQFSGVVCGPGGLAGVTYVQASGRAVDCGVDSSGAQLVLQVSTLSGDRPVEGGEQIGIDLGAAVIAVMATAWGIRALRNLLNSSGDEA